MSRIGFAFSRLGAAPTRTCSDPATHRCLMMVLLRRSKFDLNSPNFGGDAEFWAMLTNLEAHLFRFGPFVSILANFARCLTLFDLCQAIGANSEAISTNLGQHRPS